MRYFRLKISDLNSRTKIIESILTYLLHFEISLTVIMLSSFNLYRPDHYKQVFMMSICPSVNILTFITLDMKITKIYLSCSWHGMWKTRRIHYWFQKFNLSCMNSLVRVVGWMEVCALPQYLQILQPLNTCTQTKWHWWDLSHEVVYGDFDLGCQAFRPYHT